MGDYVGALDLGTTSNRFIIFDRRGRIRGLDQREHRQIMPRPGWVEHDPLGDPRQRVHRDAQRPEESRYRRERTGGGGHRQPARDHHRLGPQDRPALLQRHRLAVHPHRRHLPRAGGRRRGQDRFRARTGLPIATYFAGPKIRWILDHVPAARTAAEAGDAFFGTVESWLVWWLTGGPDGGGAHQRRDQRQPHPADGSGHPRLGPRDSGSDGHPSADAAAHRFLIRSRALGGTPRPQAPCRPGYRSAAPWATSRPPWWARPALRRARPRTPTAPAAFCCSTPVHEPVASSHGLITTAAYQFRHGAAGLLPGGLHRHRRGPGTVAARQPGHHRVGARGRGPGQ